MNKLSQCMLVYALVSVRGAEPALAQSLNPVTTQILTPYVNLPHTYYVPSVYRYYNLGGISQKYEFTVVLTNEEELTFKAAIKLNDSIHSLTYKKRGEKRVITPQETREVFRLTRDGKRITGIPTDSCWLFKVVEGRINGYSYLASESAEYLSAFQVGDGEILSLTKENLLPIVKDDPKRVKWVEKGRLGKAIVHYNKTEIDRKST